VLDRDRRVAAADAEHVALPRVTELSVTFQQDMVAVVERVYHVPGAHADDTET